MKRFVFALCLLASPAFAQQQQDPLVQNLTDDWVLTQGGLKHVATSVDALIKAYMAAKADADAARTENEKLKKLLADKDAPK